MLRKLTISAALVGIFGLAALFAPGSAGSVTVGAAPSDATEIAAPVLTNAPVINNNG